ncbi:MAG: flagellar hook-basal body complex protein FliE [Marinosulfonomonas sp.]|nr:flagellar hook-basal body complex protein FliE [Marinosulfonomonas sp.]
MDLRSSLAAQQYAATRPATAAKPAPGGQGDISKAAGEFAELLRAGEETAKATLTGGADPHALVQALAQTELAVETAVTVRNKVVEAYQEILRMPV